MHLVKFKWATNYPCCKTVTVYFSCNSFWKIETCQDLPDIPSQFVPVIHVVSTPWLEVDNFKVGYCSHLKDFEECFW